MGQKQRAVNGVNIPNLITRLIFSAFLVLFGACSLRPQKEMITQAHMHQLTKGIFDPAAETLVRQKLPKNASAATTASIEKILQLASRMKSTNVGTSEILLLIGSEMLNLARLEGVEKGAAIECLVSVSQLLLQLDADDNRQLGERFGSSLQVLTEKYPLEPRLLGLSFYTATPYSPGTVERALAKQNQCLEIDPGNIACVSHRDQLKLMLKQKVCAPKDISNEFQIELRRGLKSSSLKVKELVAGVLLAEDGVHLAFSTQGRTKLRRSLAGPNATISILSGKHRIPLLSPDDLFSGISFHVPGINYSDVCP